MDIDQRLEALAQSVELIAHMQMKNEEAHEKIEVLLGQVMESVNSLARIVHAPERRVSRLEGDPN